MRPAVVVANAGRGDWILCQVTSKPYADTRSIALADSDFLSGSLRVASFARPGKLFTASHTLLVSEYAVLTEQACARVVAAIVDMFQSPTIR